MTTLASLAEFKDHLKEPAAADAILDPKLQRFLNAATNVIENITGPINTTSAIVESHSGGSGTRSLIVLRKRPVLAITSVIEYIGTVPQLLLQAATPAAATAFSYTFELETGTLTRRVAPGYTYPFAAGDENIIVTYTAGFATVPDNVKLAALFQAAHLFQSSQQGGRPGFGSSPAAEDGYAARGYAIPNRVRELLDQYTSIPAIA